MGTLAEYEQSLKSLSSISSSAMKNPGLLVLIFAMWFIASGYKNLPGILDVWRQMFPPVATLASATDHAQEIEHSRPHSMELKLAHAATPSRAHSTTPSAPPASPSPSVQLREAEAVPPIVRQSDNDPRVRPSQMVEKTEKASCLGSGICFQPVSNPNANKNLVQTTLTLESGPVLSKVASAVTLINRVLLHPVVSGTKTHALYESRARRDALTQLEYLVAHRSGLVQLAGHGEVVTQAIGMINDAERIRSLLSTNSATQEN